MQGGVRRGNLQSPALWILLLKPLSWAEVQRLRPMGEAERGLIQAYIDDLLAVTHTLKAFIEGLEASTAYLGTRGMKLHARNCAMATTEGFPSLHRRLCPHKATGCPRRTLSQTFESSSSWGGVLLAAPTPAAPCCSAPLVPQHPRAARGDQGHDPGVSRGVTQYFSGFLADDPDTERHLDHVGLQVAREKGMIRLRHLSDQPAG